MNSLPFYVYRAIGLRADSHSRGRDIAASPTGSARRVRDPSPRPYIFAALTAGALLALAVVAGYYGAAVSLVVISWTLLLQGVGFIAFSLKPRRTLEFSRWMVAISFAILAAGLFAFATYSEVSAGGWNHVSWQALLLEILGAGVCCELGAIALMHRPNRRR